MVNLFLVRLSCPTWRYLDCSVPLLMFLCNSVDKFVKSAQPIIVVFVHRCVVFCVILCSITTISRLPVVRYVPFQVSSSFEMCWNSCVPFFDILPSVLGTLALCSCVLPYGTVFSALCLSIHTFPRSLVFPSLHLKMFLYCLSARSLW